jgi:hypothetical protein
MFDFRFFGRNNFLWWDGKVVPTSFKGSVKSVGVEVEVDGGIKPPFGGG